MDRGRHVAVSCWHARSKLLLGTVRTSRELRRGGGHPFVVVVRAHGPQQSVLAGTGTTTTRRAGLSAKAAIAHRIGQRSARFRPLSRLSGAGSPATGDSLASHRSEQQDIRQPRTRWRRRPITLPARMGIVTSAWGQDGSVSVRPRASSLGLGAAGACLSLFLHGAQE